MPPLGDENVRGLDVAVNDTGFMRRFQCFRYLDGERQKAVQLERMSADRVFQGVALEELHREIVPAVVLADIVERADVGMIQGGSSPGLALKTVDCIGVASDLGG